MPEVHENDDDDDLPDLISPEDLEQEERSKGEPKQLPVPAPQIEKEIAPNKSKEVMSKPAAVLTRDTRRTAAGSNRKLTREDALRCNEELYQGFTTDHFQRELANLASKHKEGSMPFLKARQELFLTVQKEVLPKYGFEGTLNGVFKLMGATQPFINDPEFKEIASKINDVIGVTSPPETWGNLTKALNEKPPSKKPPSKEAPPATTSKFKGHTAAYLPGNRFNGLPSSVNGASLSRLLEAKSRPYNLVAAQSDSERRRPCTEAELDRMFAGPGA